MINQEIKKMCEIYDNLLEFLESEDDIEISIINFTKTFNEQNILNNPHELRLFLRMILKISKNYHREPNFFSKIYRILKYCKDAIKRYFTNHEIFTIFKRNKRIILFLIQENIFVMDQQAVNEMQSNKYQNEYYTEYFLPEIKPFLREINDEIITDDYEQKRLIGENDLLICKFIREDSAEEFIAFVNRTNTSLKSSISRSIFETNSFLLKKEKVSLIEYAAFCGSIQIFQYLLFNKVELTKSLWFFAIHGKNPELIHYLENYHVLPADNSYAQCFDESIKCHHNDIANYFQTNYLKYNAEKINEMFIHNLKYFNLTYIQNFITKNPTLIIQSFFYYLCKYDYYQIVKILINNVYNRYYTIILIFFFCNRI